MAQKFEDENEPNFSRLLSTLLESGVQNSNNALYQVISTVIKNLNSSFKGIRSKLAALTVIVSGSPPSGGGLVNATYITKDNEIVTLPNSIRLLAGTGISFDDTVANQRTINSLVSGSSSAFFPIDGIDGEDGMPGLNGKDGQDLTETSGYWSPLTDGDLVAAELIFANGDTVSVWTPTP